VAGEKFTILITVVMMQWKPVSEEAVKALNCIDLVFHDAPRVREKWASYLDSLGRRDLLDEERGRQWRKKQLELIHEMASHLGFDKTLKQLDFDRVYSPEGLAPLSLMSIDQMDELMAALGEIKEERQRREQPDEG